MNNSFTISTDKSRLQIEVIHQYLAEQSYWAAGIPLALVQRSIEHSVCFGVYQAERQVGFARVITDGVSLAYLADVFILSAYRGNGLGKQLVEAIVNYADFTEVRRWLLFTADAQGLYQQYGFEVVPQPEQVMVKVLRSNYL